MCNFLTLMYSVHSFQSFKFKQKMLAFNEKTSCTTIWLWIISSKMVTVPESHPYCMTCNTALSWDGLYHLPSTVSWALHSAVSILTVYLASSSKVASRIVRKCFVPSTRTSNLSDGSMTSPFFIQVAVLLDFDTSHSKVTISFSTTRPSDSGWVNSTGSSGINQSYLCTPLSLDVYNKYGC